MSTAMVPANAADALGSMGQAAKEAVPELIRELKDEDGDAADAAAEALRNISSKNGICDVRCWLYQSLTGDIGMAAAKRESRVESQADMNPP